MLRVMKVAAAVSVAAVALAACGSSTTGGAGGGATTSGGSAAKVKIGMAYDVGGRGDQSFNDAAARGLDEAK